MFRTITAVVASATALAAACAAAAPAGAADPICGEGTYAYAGMGSLQPASGVSATIAPTAAPSVRAGHVDGWVGVGGEGLGPKGVDEWIQVGLTSVPKQPGNSIYVEIVRPGHAYVYRVLRRGVAVGQQNRFAVLELAGRPNWWRVWLDGSAATAPVYLPDSHGRWSAQAVGESWAGMSSGACNAYAYAFRKVAFASAQSRAWSPFVRIKPFEDTHYLLVRHSPSSFLARSVVLDGRVPAAVAP